MKSTEQVRLQFEAEGVSIKDWAEARGYAQRLVYAVMHGTVKCKRGTSHRIAVELGLKAMPITTLLTHGEKVAS